MDDIVGIVLLISVLIVGGLYILECGMPITQTIDGAVIKKTMELDVLDKAPGSYIYTVWVKAGGKVYKFTVGKSTYFSLEEGAPVKVGLAIGRMWGTYCTSPVLIVP